MWYAFITIASIPSIVLNDKNFTTMWAYFLSSIDTLYKSHEKGNIKVKFIFNKFLTSTCCMFRGCSSLKSIDLSSFNTTNVENMNCMFAECSSLQSIDLSSFKTTNVEDMRWMLYGCSSLQSINLSSFNTTNVYNYNMRWMFSGCSSLKKENVKISESGNNLLDEKYWEISCKIF